MIVALGAFLRLWQAGESLWIDELHTSWVVSGTLGDVLPRAAMGNQSPFYFWGMWLLVQVIGQSEWTLRLPSLAAGIALPAAVYYLVGQVSNLSKQVSGQVGNLSYVALAAALLVAIDPTCIFYAQEARPYAWVMLLAVAELVLLRRLIEGPTIGRRMALLANSLILFYLHYTAAVFLVGVIVLLPMLVRLTGTAYRTKWLVVDLLLAAALAAPGVIQMADIFERRTNWEAFVKQPSWPALFTEIPFAGWALVGAVVVALALVPRVLPGNAPTRGSASAAPPTSSRSLRSWTTGLSEQSPLWYSVLLASILIPLLLSWSVTALDAARMYHPRYLVALVPLAAAAACLATLWMRWRAAQVLVLLLLAGWHLYESSMLQQFARDGRFLAARNEDWRGAVQFLNRQARVARADLIVHFPGLIETLFDPMPPNESERQYHYFALRGLYHLECPDESIEMPATKWLPSQLHDPKFKSDRPLWIWVVARGPPSIRDEIADGYRFGEMLTAEREGRRWSFAVTNQRSFGGVHIACVERAKEAP